jgi:hypothetical protein
MISINILAAHFLVYFSKTLIYVLLIDHILNEYNIWILVVLHRLVQLGKFLSKDSVALLRTKHCCVPLSYTGHKQKNGVVSKVCENLFLTLHITLGVIPAK